MSFEHSSIDANQLKLSSEFYSFHGAIEKSVELISQRKSVKTQLEAVLSAVFTKTELDIQQSCDLVRLELRADLRLKSVNYCFLADDIKIVRN